MSRSRSGSSSSSGCSGNSITTTNSDITISIRQMFKHTFNDNPFFLDEILNPRETYGKDGKRHRPATLGSEPSSTRERRAEACRRSRSTRVSRPLLNCVPINGDDHEQIGVWDLNRRPHRNVALKPAVAAEAHERPVRCSTVCL